MSEGRPLHQLFGLAWMDFFQGSAIEVDTEVDLSLKKQLLDLVFTRKGTTLPPQGLPDGFGELGTYNLVTFKSHQEAFDFWAVCELIAHYVNHRKQTSPSWQNLLPESEFRLFAVSARFPQQLAQQIPLTWVQEGVYEIRFGPLLIRVIVVARLPQAEANALLHLFSAKEDLVRYGRDHYQPRSPEISTLLLQLFQAYSEDPEMSDKLKELARQTLQEMLKHLTPEQRLEGVSPQKRLEGLSAEQRLEGLSVEEVVRALSPEALAALRQQLKTNGSSAKPQ